VPTLIQHRVVVCLACSRLVGTAGLQVWPFPAQDALLGLIAIHSPHLYGQMAQPDSGPTRLLSRHRRIGSPRGESCGGNRCASRDSLNRRRSAVLWGRMKVWLEVPDALAEQLAGEGQNLSRAALEAWLLTRTGCSG
jgi:hypothetical protein